MTKKHLDNMLAEARASGRGEMWKQNQALMVELRNVLRCFDRDNVPERQEDHHGDALREVKGLRVAYNLMQKGMESQCELMDGLKQDNRGLRDEVARLRAALAALLPYVSTSGIDSTEGYTAYYAALANAKEALKGGA